MAKRRFKKHQPVVLKAFEDQPIQTGILESGRVVNGTLMVTLHDKFLDGPHDDGLREVGDDQVMTRKELEATFRRCLKKLSGFERRQDVFVTARDATDEDLVDVIHDYAERL